jgi:hypothetical protein
MESLTSGAFSRTAAGMVFGLGGLAGVVALLTGALVNGRAARGMMEIGARLRAESRPPSAEEAAQMARLQTRMAWGSRIAMVLLIVAVVCMAIGRLQHVQWPQPKVRRQWRVLLAGFYRREFPPERDSGWREPLEQHYGHKSLVRQHSRQK